MTDQTYSDEKLNLFIDNQLDPVDDDAIRNAMLEDAALRERVCQLRAVRGPGGYACENVPVPDADDKRINVPAAYFWKGIAASLLVAVGMFTGWLVNDAAHSTKIASAVEVFQYFKSATPADRAERKIILHITTGDINVVSNALDEAEQLLASYRDAGTPMKLDIVTFREGINMLRVGASRYLQRIEDILESNENVSLYACMRSIEKTAKTEGRRVVMMGKAIINKTAQELISERLKKGWIYIKV